ncbi:MAG: helicase C-terminal domain-containing protein [Anaerolineae bacterium]|jgi:predicted DnaQ family exonuclease/DinG family helicase
MPRQYVALDLETTGLDPQRDVIIEVGAVRFGDDGPMKRFSSFVNPGGRPIPAKIQHLTGISPEDLANAPQPWDVMRKLADFVGNDVVVGHSIGFDTAFLSRYRLLQRNRAIDTFELSTILLPHMARHSLQHLVGELDLASNSAHRALDDAEAAMRLFQALREAALGLPIELLERVVSLGRRSNWAQASFFEDVLKEQLRSPVRNSIAQQLAAKGGLGAGPLLAGVEPARRGPAAEPQRPPTPLDVQELVATLEPGGRVAKAMGAYERRPQQLEMLAAICQALNEGRHLVVEAATGVGKSLAYLLPALVFAHTNHDRVVISTHTINLQEQLYTKDIPQLARALGTEPSVALLKGRNNYLCPARLHALEGRPSLYPEQALALAKILVWTPSTATGDRAELFLNTPSERGVWQQVCADPNWCDGDNCRYRQQGRCYFHRARQAAQLAEVVIVNHSLLTMDACMESGSLPEYEHLIVDEAHHFPDACTNALKLELTFFQFNDILDSLLSGEQGSESGALSAVLRALRRIKARAARALQDCERLSDALASLRSHLSAASASLDVCAERLLGSSGRTYVQQHRLTARERASAEWTGLVEAWAAAKNSASTVLRQLDEVKRQLVTLRLDEDLMEAIQAMGAGSRELQELVDGFEQVIAAPTEGHVYWLSARETGGPVTLNRAPISVAESLQDRLFSEKRTVVLTSATLTTAGTFDYYLQQVGLDSVRTLTIGSPFDYRGSALVCIARDVPEPRNPGHQKAVEDAILHLARAIGGRLMALFTSYSQLKATTRSLSHLLEQENILLYSQSEGGGRNQLLEGFKSAERAVLLGTRSFWEGVDVPGDALQCLVMAKLPFMVPDDPIVAARSEQYSDSFSQYLLPEAILTFRQGFGRLIRTQADRGAFVILDSRIRTKTYGNSFLRSLPDCTFFEGTMASIPEKVVLWLNRTQPG